MARHAKTFKLALKRAKIGDYVKPVHDLRRMSITIGGRVGRVTAELEPRETPAELAAEIELTSA